MGRDTPVLNRVAVQWRPNLKAYIADCDCGHAIITLKLSLAEHWALTHDCQEPS